MFLNSASTTKVQAKTCPSFHCSISKWNSNCDIITLHVVGKSMQKVSHVLHCSIIKHSVILLSFNRDVAFPKPTFFCLKEFSSTWIALHSRHDPLACFFQQVSPYTHGLCIQTFNFNKLNWVRESKNQCTSLPLLAGQDSFLNSLQNLGD